MHGALHGARLGPPSDGYEHAAFGGASCEAEGLSCPASPSESSVSQSSLSRRLSRVAPARWQLSLCAPAGEGGGCLVTARTSEFRGVRGAAEDPERARAEAARRARTRVRRYCAANGLSRFGTLTYGPPFCTDPDQLRADMARFFRRLRTAQGQGPLPYLWVPEFHADGERFHAHYAMDRFVPRQRIAEAWGHGHVFIKLLSDMRVGAATWEESRRAAAYVSKYVSKTFTGPQVFGRQRYGVAEGFQPTVQRLTGKSRADVLQRAAEIIGRPPSKRWYSEDEEDWKGPPAVWFAWE